jgi:formylmethanofuran dehydrogenase subunit A
MFKLNNVNILARTYKMLKAFTTKTYKSTTNKKNIDPTKDMDIYVKKEKLIKDSQENKVKLKNIDETKCLVLHPVFNIK